MGPHAPGDEGPYCEEIQHAQISAVVPERVARGVFSTGAVVVQGRTNSFSIFCCACLSPNKWPPASCCRQAW